MVHPEKFHEKFETGYRQRREFGAIEWGLVFMMLSIVHLR